MTLYLKLCLVFMRIGFFGFGGGLAMMPMIYQGALLFQNMTEKEFMDLVGVSQMTPGPLGVNAATFVGYKVAGVAGACFATFGEAVPSFVLVTLMVYFMGKYRESRFMDSIFSGIRPATVGLIGSAIIMLGKNVFLPLSAVTPAAIIFAAAAFVLCLKTKISPVWITIASGIIGAAVVPLI
ncbi:MAG: chromate transporter [Eubacterium sp.]|nr:chromate transporter [Eubacterium sp.]